MDGLAFENNMMALGLSGGRGRRPAIAIDKKDGFTVLFSDVFPLNHHAIASFTSDFLNGKIQSPADSLKGAKIIAAISARTPLLAPRCTRKRASLRRSG